MERDLSAKRPAMGKRVAGSCVTPSTFVSAMSDTVTLYARRRPRRGRHGRENPTAGRVQGRGRVVLNYVDRARG